VSTLTITRGLPGSGKTTYAKTWVSEDVLHRSRLNRDDFREMLHGGPHGYDRPLEQAVTWAHQGAVRCLLAAGRDVICDDMNLQNRQVKEWMKLAKEAGADFEVVDLTNVPVGTCIDRDKSRFLQGGRHVGEEYITKKHQQFIKGRQYPLPLPELSAGQYVEPYTPPTYNDGTLAPKAILVDIDGTMALMNGRGPFEWWAVGQDVPNQPVVDLVWSYSRSSWSADVEVIFMSGRDEVCRAETTDWLAQLGFVGRKLFMRPQGDKRRDSVVKLELFDEHIRHNYDVQFVLDDRDQVVEMWRSLGLTCLQVNYGNF
jgi:predicted kinase